MKKIYEQPSIDIVFIELQNMIAESGKVYEEEVEEQSEILQSRETSTSIWDDEE